MEQSGQGREPVTREDIRKLQHARGLGAQLHSHFIRDVVFEVTETIQLEGLGSASLERVSSAWEARIRTADYNAMINGIKELADLPIGEEHFEVVHRFPGETVIGCEAKTLDGQVLQISQQYQPGSLALTMKIPMKRDPEGDDTVLRFPGYSLSVQLGQLPQRLGDDWYLQWVHGALGTTVYKLNVIVPELRRRRFTKLLRSQIFAASPRNTDFQRYPKQSNVRRYSWACRIQKDETFTATLTYGTRYRRWLFSPAGFIVANLIVIALTLLFTEPIAALLAKLGLTLPGTSSNIISPSIQTGSQRI